MSDDDSERESASKARRGASPKLIAGVVLAAVLLLFGILNTDDVYVDFIVDSVRAPIIVVIVISAVIGAALGALAMHRSRE